MSWDLSLPAEIAPAGMLATTVISAFRADELIDAGAIGDPVALRWLDDGQQIMVGTAGLRKDLLLKNDGTLSAASALSALTDALAVGPEWRAALCDYLAYRYLKTLDSNKANREEAVSRLKSFYAALGY